MQVETWLAYVAAYTVLSLIPGPSVLMVVAQSLTRGRRAAFACITGDLIGGIVIMTTSYAGLGLLLAASATAFAILKWAGVIYMACLGIAQILAAHHASTMTTASKSGTAASSLRAGFLTGILNPKAIMFYMAFLAQFIDPTAAQLPQLLILMASSTLIVAVVLSGYALGAASIRTRLHSPRTQRRMAYAGGSCHP